MTEIKETVFDVLGLKNPSKELKDQMQMIAFKCTTLPGYNRSDAVQDIIKACELEDTPDNRLLCVHAIVFGEMMQNLQSKLNVMAQAMGLGDPDED